MAEATTVRYRGECGHVNEVTFIGDTQSWESKTRGCNSCGQTSQFTEIHVDESTNGEPMIEHHSDSALNPSQDDSEEQNSDDEYENVVREVEKNPSATVLEDLSYRELQSVAHQFDGVKGNIKMNELFDELVKQDSTELTDVVSEVVEDQE